MLRRIGMLVVSSAVVLAVAGPALAATTTGIGTFTPLAGSSTQYATTMQLPAVGFPAASVRSTSRAGQVGVQTGATNWFSETTPVGLQYGSSKDQPYLNLRPKVDSPTGASLTTYTFDRATPTGWAFVLGDIDADAVTISATKADGTAATAAELGFQSVFSLCDSSPKPSACSGVVAPFDLPTWDAGTRTLTGNLAAEDTTGAAGWFEPTTSLKTLSFSFVQREGFPIYQTWFAVKKQDVTGTVASSGSCAVADIDVRLLDATGAVVSSTQTAADGTYAFAGVAASAGYDVEISGLADDCVADGPTREAIDLTAGDDTADFAVRDLVPLPISGVVEDFPGGNPLANVTVTIDDGTNPPRSTTTDSDGFYLFDTNPPATYTLTATPPPGYTQIAGPANVVVAPGETEPKTGRDFLLDADPTVSGTVSDSGGGIGGVTVVLLDGAVEVARTTTAVDGTYSFDLVPPGTYSVTVPDPPGDYDVPSPEAVTALDEDVSGVDLALTRPGSIAGTVTNGGAPVAGTVLTITGPSAFSQQVTTDAEGNYAVGDLPPGTYTVTLTPPSGTTIADPSLEVVIPSGGEDFGAVNFAIADVQAPDPDPGTPGTPGDSGAADDAPLPDTGGPSSLIGVLGVGLLLVGSGLLLGARWRRSNAA